MPRIINMRTEPAYKDKTYRDSHNAIRIDRQSKWGNPFIIGKDGTREEVITKYRFYIESLNRDYNELKGKDLCCWCTPLPCHGEILLELAN